MGSAQIQDKVKEINRINTLLSVGQSLRYDYVVRDDKLILTAIIIDRLPRDCDTLDIIIPACIDRVDVGLQDKSSGLYNLFIVNNSREKIKYLILSNINKDMTGYFGTLILDQSIEEIDLSELYIEHVKNIDNMFSGMSRLYKLQLNPQIFKNTKSMSSTFAGCKSLTSLDFSNYDLSNVFKADNCFEWCRKLETIKFRKDAFQKLVSSVSMFEQCENLKDININELNLSNLKYMSTMFSMCRQLERLELPSLGEVYDAYGAFSGCNELKYLDIRNFDISYKISTISSVNGFYTYEILKGQVNLETLYIRQSFISRLRSCIQKQIGGQIISSDQFIIERYLKETSLFGGVTGTNLKVLKTTATNESEREIRAYREKTRTA